MSGFAFLIGLGLGTVFGFLCALLSALAVRAELNAQALRECERPSETWRIG